MELVHRLVEARVAAALTDTRVVAIIGPRQAGKSTLARGLAAKRTDRYATLDDADTLSAARDDPHGFVANIEGMLVIDEIQRAPELVLAIKLAVDLDPSPGRFLLTGSTHLLSVRDVADTLAGRMEMISMWPLAQTEIERSSTTFIDRVLTAEAPPAHSSNDGKSEYLSRIASGGFPEALTRARSRRADWYRAYVTSVIERESKEVLDTNRGDDIMRLLRLVAARHGSLLNVADLARDAGIAERTAHRYLHLLEAVFLITRTEPWFANLSSRVTKAPKVTVADSGLANYLRRGSASDPTAAGALAEGFVLEELRRQLTWSEHRGDLFHFRDKAGREVDAVIETDGGKILAVEVKLGASIGRRQFSGLTHLRDALGPRFCAGIVMHGGSETHSHGDRLWSTPISSLWS